MLHLELPHVNVLSKIDLIRQYGDLGAPALMSQIPSRLISASPRNRGSLPFNIADFNLDFSADGPDVLENFDFDSFLHNTDDTNNFGNFDFMNLGEA